jgi:hypothetical protein
MLRLTIHEHHVIRGVKDWIKLQATACTRQGRTAERICRVAPDGAEEDETRDCSRHPDFAQRHLAAAQGRPALNSNGFNQAP